MAKTDNPVSMVRQLTWGVPETGGGSTGGSGCVSPLDWPEVLAWSGGRNSRVVFPTSTGISSQRLSV